VKASVCSFYLVVVYSQLSFAQQVASDRQVTPATQGAVQTSAPPSDKPRIYVAESNSWQMVGSAGGGHGSFGAASAGGASPQTAEIVKTFAQRCPQVIANNRADMADYVVTLEHEGGKGLLRKKDKVAVFVQKNWRLDFQRVYVVSGRLRAGCLRSHLESLG
jgi:hypothetical protein